MPVLFDYQQLDDAKHRDCILHDHVCLNAALHGLHENHFLHDEQKHHAALNKKYPEAARVEVKAAKERRMLA